MPKKLDLIDFHVGQRVRLRRLILGLSQEKLGHGLGVTLQQVQKYEKGTNRITASRLQQIARTLSVPVRYFFEDQPSDQVGSNGTEAAHHPETEFLSNRDAFRLNTAFPRIKDVKVRRAVIDLLSVMGEEQAAKQDAHVAANHDQAS
jgi:transcriptional regulator with XRE-family HTH domain